MPGGSSSILRRFCVCACVSIIQKERAPNHYQNNILCAPGTQDQQNTTAGQAVAMGMACIEGGVVTAWVSWVALFSLVIQGKFVSVFIIVDACCNCRNQCVGPRLVGICVRRLHGAKGCTMMHHNIFCCPDARLQTTIFDKEELSYAYVSIYWHEMLHVVRCVSQAHLRHTAFEMVLCTEVPRQCDSWLLCIDTHVVLRFYGIEVRTAISMQLSTRMH